MKEWQSRDGFAFSNFKCGFYSCVMKLSLFAKCQTHHRNDSRRGVAGDAGRANLLGKIVAAAVREAKIYRAAGLDGVALENMHDVPYLRGGVGPEMVAAMSIVEFVW